MQPEAHHHSSQHARPQPTPAREQINKKTTALTSSAAHLRAMQAKEKNHPVQSELSGQLSTGQCCCFFSEPFWFCSANSKSSTSWGFWGTVRTAQLASWWMGRWQSCTDDAQDPTSSKCSSWTWHMRRVTLLHHLSHSQQVINTRNTSPCLV